ncbi:MAG: hypothetical protein ACRC2S_07830 [Waterburya sp.]
MNTPNLIDGRNFLDRTVLVECGVNSLPIVYRDRETKRLGDEEKKWMPDFRRPVL